MTIDLTSLPTYINDYFYPSLHCHKRYLLSKGGGGSGKSTFAAQRMVYRMLEKPDRNGIASRKNNTHCKFSVFAELKKVINDWGLSDYVDVNLTDMSLRFPNGNMILCRGLEDPEKIKSIAFESGHIVEWWLEEATEMTRNDIDQVDTRLRGGRDSKTIHLTFNPISKLRPIYEKFYKSTFYQKKTLYLESNYKTNAYLDANYKVFLEGLKETNPDYYAVYCLGEWGEVGSLVFNNIDIQPIPYSYDDFDCIVQGCDFGFNDPNVYVRWGVKDQNLYALDEIAVKETTCAQFIEFVKPLYEGGVIYGDSAYPAYVTEFQNSGVEMRGAVKGKDSISSGIDFLKSRRIIIDDTRTPSIAMEFQNYSWKKDANDEPLDIPVDRDNHTIDATRYAVEELRAGSGWAMVLDG